MKNYRFNHILEKASSKFNKKTSLKHIICLSPPKITK